MSPNASRLAPLALYLALGGCGEDPQQAAARQRAEQAAAEVRAEIAAAREQAQREMQASQEARPAVGDVTPPSEPGASDADAEAGEAPEAAAVAGEITEGAQEPPDAKMTEEIQHSDSD